MKKIFLVITMMALVLAGCKDKSGIYDILSDYDARISELELICKQMNTNIESIQTIVEAAEYGDYITSITPINEGGEIIGYTMTFKTSNPITIYNGKDGQNGHDGVNGQDGHTPVVGVTKDTDGIYYWTLNGTWLLDNDGNKLRVTGEKGDKGDTGATGATGATGQNGTNGINGTNGTDGVTPQLKIENDYWYISYDNGATWTQLGKAKGDKGDTGATGAAGTNGTNGQDGQDGDSMFQSVTQDENNVYFILADGTVITIKKAGTSDFNQTIVDNLVTALTIDKEFCYIVLGSTDSIISTTYPFPTSKVTWRTSNPEVLTVNNGKISTISYGKATITASAGDKSRSCVVYIVDDASKRAFKLNSLGTSECYFSPAQLLCQPSNNIWKFGDSQIIINTVAYTYSTTTDWIGRFGIPGYPEGETIQNAGEIGNWRQFTYNEWDNLFKYNPNYVVSVAGIAGVVMLPRHWPTTLSIQSGQSISLTEWQILENNGAIFLATYDENTRYHLGCLTDSQRFECVNLVLREQGLLYFSSYDYYYNQPQSLQHNNPAIIRLIQDIP